MIKETISRIPAHSGGVDTSSSFWNQLSDVPTDVSGFTVDQVLRCLTLLGFVKHVEDFRREDINGELLVEMDRDMLVMDFNFRSTDALKLVKFATSGWRGSK